MTRPGSLLDLNDLDFLKALVRRYPETEYLAGKAESSPEGNSILKSDALAYQVFPESVAVDPAAVEADRTFLGLLTLKWVMNGDYGQFTSLQKDPQTKLSRKSFDALRDDTKRIAGTDEDLEFCLYSLACNDLGKSLALVEKHREVMGRPAEDHDQLLGALIRHAPALFPGYQDILTAEQQQMYLDGIEANLNLGQFVQGENLPVNLAAMQALGAKSRALRLVCEVFDFAGATGHIDPNGSVLMTEDHYRAFSTAIDELTAEPFSGAYQRYIRRRGALAGIDAEGAEGYALSRAVALCRALTAAQGESVQSAWKNLSEEDRRILTEELNETGLDNRRAILVYYAPAMIANAVKSAADYGRGVELGIRQLADIYRGARAAGHDRAGNGVITVNIVAAAREKNQS